MQHLRHILTLCLVIIAAPAWAESPPVLVIAADSWCPINCTKPEKHLGVGIDLAKAIFEPLGYEIQYEIMPWTDALEKVRAGEVAAVIGASVFDDKTLIFPRESVYNISDDFYVLKGNSWRFQGVNTLKGKKLGAIADYGYGPAVQEYVSNHKADYDTVQLATGDKALRDNIRKLQNNQIDTLVETKPVMEYTIATMKLENKIEWAGGSPQAPVFLAFSPALPQSKTLAAQFDAGVRALEASGKLEGFYEAYGLSTLDRK